MLLLKKKLYLLSFFLLILFSFTLYGKGNYSDARKFYNEFKYDDAIYILETLSQKNNYKLEENLLLVDSYIRIKNYRKALVLIEALKKNHPRDYTVLERELEISLLENNNSKATDIVGKILKLDSKNYYASYAEGLLRERLGYITSAISLYERARVINPKRGEATVALGYLKLLTGRRQEAERLFLENVDNNNRNYLSYYHLANYYYITRNYNSSLTEIENSFYYNPKSVETRRLQVNTLTALKRYSEAVSVLESLSDDTFDNINKNFFIAEVYEEAGNYNKAKEYYINNLRVNTEDELGRLSYERVLLITDPKVNTAREKEANYYVSRAEYYGRLADPIKSFAYYKHILKINPENVFARISLSDTYKTMGYIEKSLEELKIAANMYPNEKSYSYKYDNDLKLVNRLVPSKAWGINQYNLKSPGYSLGIANIEILKETPRTLNLSIAQSLNMTLSQLTKFRVYSYYTNKLNNEALYNKMLSDKIDFYVQGRAYQDGDSITLYMELVNTLSRQVVTNFSLLMKGKDKIMNISVLATRAIAGNIPFYASVYKVDNNDIYINAGRWHGITNNMTMLLYDSQSAPYNSTKKAIDKEERDGVLMQVITADENMSLCRLVDNRAIRYVRANNIVISKK